MTDGTGDDGRDRAASVVGAALAGLLVGVIGTFKHQVGISAATGAGVPVGLVLCLATVLMLLIALRVAAPTRRYALAAAIGVVAAIVVFALPGPGGSRVILQNAAGEVWLVAPVVLAAVAIVWPRPRPHRRRALADEPGGILEDRPAE